MFARNFLDEAVASLTSIDAGEIEGIVARILRVRESKGRLFVLGVGGSAANASHAVNDLRKICGVEAYAPTDNAAELTARANDLGWESVFDGWLEVSGLCAKDGLLVLSVGGGSVERNVSVCLVRAIDLAKRKGCAVLGIVGRDGGHTKRHADACVLIPSPDDSRTTPHTEGICGVILHLLVSHPDLTKERD